MPGTNAVAPLADLTDLLDEAQDLVAQAINENGALRAVLTELLLAHDSGDATRIAAATAVARPEAFDDEISRGLMS